MAVKGVQDTKHVTVQGLDLQQVYESLRKLASVEVLVGIPEDKAQRDDDAPINNASIGFLNELGEPSMNLPARPWLAPGIRENRDKISKFMLKAAKIAVSGKASPQAVEDALHAVGITAVSGVKKRIQDGLLPPLSPVTLKARAYKGDTGAAWELSWRMAGVNLVDGQLAKPLIDTGNFMSSISYVVVDRRKGGV